GGRSGGAACLGSRGDVRDRSHRLPGVRLARHRARSGRGSGGSRPARPAQAGWRSAGAVGPGDGSAAAGAADRGRGPGRFVRSGGVAVLSVEVLTLFPRMVAAPLEESILAKAREKGLLRVRVTDIRDFAEGKHRVTDAVARLVPGVLGNELSAQAESFSRDGLLEGPQYTRPADFRGLRVPDVLLSGDHAKIAQWRREQAVARTRERRPDLLTRQKA